MFLCMHYILLCMLYVLYGFIYLICKSRNGESGNGMKGMMGMRRIMVGMLGVWVGMQSKLYDLRF